MSELRFRSDTKHRKDWFTGVSFSHPAKMALPLLVWIVENYTKPGDVILDPMAGSGTVLVACSTGRDVIAVDLEQKFVDIMEGNWEKIKQRGPQMGYEFGEAIILQGDARNLQGLLADAIVTSPPYAESDTAFHDDNSGEWYNRKRGKAFSKAGDNPSNLGNLPYGDISAIITSPPYEKTITQGGNTDVYKEKYGYQGENIGYAKPVDVVLTSPPYEDSISSADKEDGKYRAQRLRKIGRGDIAKRIENPDDRGGNTIDTKYSDNPTNIGNLKTVSYLAAMLQVYLSCHAVLRPGGLMILVLKNFIRNQQEVRLDLDTIKLCETAGFSLTERHYRKLSGQSFWRIIYRKKFPDAPVLDKEDMLVFKK